MGSPREERAAEAREAKAVFDAELAKVDGWGVREILHYLLDGQTVPQSARAGAPSADVVRALIDKAYGYTAPVPTAVETAQAELAAAQAKLDAAKAETAAGVESLGL